MGCAGSATPSSFIEVGDVVSVAYWDGCSYKGKVAEVSTEPVTKYKVVYDVDFTFTWEDASSLTVVSKRRKRPEDVPRESRPAQREASKPPAPVAPSPSIHGSGSARGRGKGSTKSHGWHAKLKKWQIKLDGRWQDNADKEDQLLRHAFLVGHSNVMFDLRGQRYECNFQRMHQINVLTGKEREIRPPPGMDQPSHALLPTGPILMVTVRAGQPGQTIAICDPNNLGSQINVFVPSIAAPGSKIAVPLPETGESIQAVQAKQKKHDEELREQLQEHSVDVDGNCTVGVRGVILGDQFERDAVAEKDSHQVDEEVLMWIGIAIEEI
jgi:hypothetical protein